MTRFLRPFLLLALGLAAIGAEEVRPAMAQSSGTIESTPLPDLDPNAPPPAAPAAPAPAPQPAAPAAPVAPAEPAKPLPMGAIESPEMTFPEVAPGMSIAPELQQSKLPDTFTLVSKPALVMSGQSSWKAATKN